MHGGQVGSFGKQETASGKQVKLEVSGKGNEPVGSFGKQVRLEASGRRVSGIDTSFVSCEFVLMLVGCLG